MMSEKKYTILVAIDPTVPELRPTEASLYWLKRWISERDAQVDAIFVSSEHSNSKAITEAEFLDYVSSLKLGPTVRAKILPEKSNSRRKLVDTLVKYANENGADLIAVSSHGRSILGRLVLGSFAESLLAVSRVPILFLSGRKEVVAPSNKVMFPTDLSDFSKAALDLFLQQITGYQGEVILYHATLPTGAAFTAGFFGAPVYLPASYWAEQRQWIDKECQELLLQVESKGFRGRVEIHDGVLNIAASIEKFAQDEAIDLIGMASISRGFDSAVMGSVAREIFRQRKWPVWVSGPEALPREN